MPPEVQAEIYPLIMEYALYGRQPGKNISDIAKGVFALIKPNIDVNTTRYENGKKGARYGKLGGRPPKNKGADIDSAYSKSFAEEVEQMKQDEIWLEQGVCVKFSISKEEAITRLDRFSNHCQTECSDKPHTSYADAQRHFCAWIRKAYPPKPKRDTDDDPPFPDYTFNGGFGGMDS